MVEETTRRLHDPRAYGPVGGGFKTQNTEGTEEHRVTPVLFFPIFAVDHPLNAVAQVSHIEIDEKADADPAQPQIREKLRLVDRMYQFNTLHLDDNQIFDNLIDPISKLDLFSVENHRQPDLASNFESALPEFMGETSLIGTL